MKATKKYISVLLIAMMICCSLPSLAFAESRSDAIDITQWTVLGKCDKDYSLHIEKNQNEYFMYVPDAVISNKNSKLEIQAPEEQNTDEFQVSYDSYSVANMEDPYSPIAKTVSSENKGVVLTDYFYENAFNHEDCGRYVYTQQIKLKVQNEEYTVVLKPYCAIKDFSLKSEKQRPMAQISDSEWMCTAVKGETYKLLINPYHTNKRITINGNTVVEGDGYNGEYKVTEDEQNVEVKISYIGDKETVEERTYTLKVKGIEKDYYPVVNNPGNNATLTCTQFDDYKIELDVKNVDEKTTYQWTNTRGIGNKATTTELDSTTNVCQVDTKTAARSAQNKYICKITNIVDGLEYTTNITLKIEIKALSVDPPTIVVNPQSAEYTAGTKAVRLEVTANGTPGGNLTYQWYENSENQNKGGKAIEGETKSYYMPKVNEVKTTYYYCEIWDTQQGITCKTPAVSECAEIKVTQLKLNLTGEGTKSNPYQITSEADLKEISDHVDQGYTFADTYFELKNDITLSNEWKPIGSTKNGKNSSDNGTNLNPFSGIFDGNNYTVTIAEGGYPLFNYVREATICNLKIYGKKINGYGLVDKYAVDYGEDGNYKTGVPETVTIDNVTLCSGSATKKSGFIGGFGSGMNITKIMNSTIEEGVTIGYDKDQNTIGSFAGLFNGVMVNCKSAADVYGVDAVGGLVGMKGQSMGPCSVTSSAFTGNVYATGERIGGIIGSGYADKTAPNTPVVMISNCYVSGTITGRDVVGGLLGAEPVCEDCWSNGTGGVYSSCFYGKVNATDGMQVGAVVGFLRSYNKYQNISDNIFTEGCGADKAIGKIQEIIYTDHPSYGNHGIEIGSFDEKSGGNAVADIRSADVITKLNQAKQSLKNWVADANGYPTFSDKAVVYKITLSGKYKTEYFIGDKQDTKNMTITATYSNGVSKTLTASEVEFVGFDTSSRGVKTVTVKYGAAETTYEIRVLESQPKGITVYLTVYGDEVHNSDSDGNKHTLASKNLDTWVKRAPYSLNTNSTVKDVLEMALKQNGMTWSNPSGNYVATITYKGTTLGEFTNGKNSGWMYTLNGKHPLLGVSEQFLSNNDEIVWHYTDDYTKEEGSDKWNTPGATDEVKNVTTDTKTGTTTSPTEVKVSEKTNADGTKEKVAEVTVSADNQKEILKQAKDNKSNEIILVVSKDSVKDAAKADIKLDKSFIDSIVKDTDAKLTIKTPFGDKAYTQDELKALSAGATGSVIMVTIEKAEEPTDDVDNTEKIAKAKKLTASMKLTVRSAKTAKKNVKVTVKTNSKTTASIKELKDLGYTVKYRYYRSTKKAASYKSAVTKSTKTYINTAGTKGKMYYYKAQVRVYDENGKLITKTALKQCKYANRKWSK